MSPTAAPPISTFLALTTAISRSRTVDEIYSSDDVEPALLARKDEAYARAYYLVARNCIRGGNIARGLEYLTKARRLWPAITTPRRMAGLAKNVISKPLRMVQSSVMSRWNS